jgi:hypothetical protein
MLCKRRNLVLESDVIQSLKVLICVVECGRWRSVDVDDFDLGPLRRKLSRPFTISEHPLFSWGNSLISHGIPHHAYIIGLSKSINASSRVSFQP